MENKFIMKTEKKEQGKVLKSLLLKPLLVITHKIQNGGYFWGFCQVV